MPGTFRGVRDSHGTWQSTGDGQCSNGSFGHHARSGSVDSLDSNSGSSVSSTGHARQLSGESTEFIPTRTVAKAPTLPAHNPLQFVKVQTSPLCRKAEQQLKLTKTVKITREKLKEEEEEWQLNLDDWKSRRRKLSEKVIQRQEEMRQIEAEEQMRQLQGQKKGKTFSEMIEERSQRKKKSYNLSLYFDDDSRASGTSETEEQGSSSADIQHLNTRSDASDVTSEAESVPESLDSDTRSSDRVCEQDNDILQEQLPFHQVSSYRLESSKNEFENQKIEHHEENYPHLHPLCESLSKMEHSSAEPSDSDAAPGEFEPVSSEEDGGCCIGVGNNDSGLESLCGSHRAGGDPDSASDFSQDSCSGLDKSTIEVECEKETENYRQHVNERNKVSTNCGNSVYVPKLGDKESTFTIQIKPGGDTKSFGFTLKGGSDQGLQILVESVASGSPSDLAGLKVGDEILAINEETTSGCSHASLVFAVKQAIYTEQLNMIISRPGFTANLEGDATHQLDRKQPPKSTKRGSAFAQKIAMFNTSSNESSTSVHLRKAHRAQELKGDSLVLRRRSAFENSSLNKDESKSNRRSLSLLQDVKCTEKASSNDRRHSVGFSNESEVRDNMGFEETTLITKKPPPPPVPVKPKLLQKPSSELQDICVPLQDCAGTEFSTISPNAECFDRNDLVCNEQLIPQSIDEFCTESFTNNANEYVQSIQGEDLDLGSYDSSYSHAESNSSELNKLQKNISQFETLGYDKSTVDVPESSSEWNITAQESADSQYFHMCKYPVIDEEKELNTDRLSHNLNNFPLTDISPDNQDELHIQPHVVPFENYSLQHDERTFFDENQFDVEIQNMVLPETSVDSIESNELQYLDFQDDIANSCEIRTDTEGNESSDLLEESHDDGSPDFIGPDEILNDEVVSEEIISEFSEDNITVLEMQREDLDKSENYLSDLENDSETERNLDDEGTPLPPVDLESPSHDTELSEEYLANDAAQSQAEIIDFPEDRKEEVEQLVTHFTDNDTSTMTHNIEYQIENLCDDIGHQIQLENNYIAEPSGQDETDVVYLEDENQLLLDDLDMPCNLEPPKEKPPPPPPLDMEVLENKTPSFMRVNSTKRIKKEIKKRRSDFLGLDPSAADDVDIILPRPPQMEEILKSEQELAREQRQWLESRLSLPDKCLFIDRDTDTNEGTSTELCVDVEDGGEADGVSSLLHEEKLLMEAVLNDSSPLAEYEGNWPDGEKQELLEIPLRNYEFDSREEEPKTELPQEEKTNDVSSHAITRQNIFSLGAAPKAKIMDSDKWIKQNDKVSPPKPPDSLFFDSSYAIQQKQQKAKTPDSYEYSLQFSPDRKQVHNRYSMPSLSSRYPDVTVRTWREREHFSQRKPRSYTHPDLVSVSSSIESAKHDRSHSEPVENYYSENIRQSPHSDIQSEQSASVSERKICVSRKNRCAHCSAELVHGAAMGIEALQLYYHIQCFTCSVCKAELGNGVHGTDVQVWNKNLYCQACFSCIDMNDGAKI